ncbi:hypothetical protein NPIL_338581 [Nephila pilipes]|uniref:Uncharacterized protein n=1 Tax=Nephila pilipes TaxID=299642 RepID=A0A8X6UNF4_NEPPI|nr:hypothetical protein NPIL_338581 [Nephila pilipes]
MTDAGTSSDAMEVTTNISLIPDEVSASLGSNSYLATAQCSQLVTLVNINNFEHISKLLSCKIDQIGSDGKPTLTVTQNRNILKFELMLFRAYLNDKYETEYPLKTQYFLLSHNPSTELTQGHNQGWILLLNLTQHGKGPTAVAAGFTDDSPFAFSSTAFAVEGGEEVSASHVSMFDAMSGAQYEDGRQYGPQH